LQLWSVIVGDLVFLIYRFSDPGRAVILLCVRLGVWTITFELNNSWPMYLAWWLIVS